MVVVSVVSGMGFGEVCRLEGEVVRLTAELAEADKLLRVHEATDDARLAAAEAREKSLRAIMREMVEHPGWLDAWELQDISGEWYRRAGEVT